VGQFRKRRSIFPDSIEIGVSESLLRRVQGIRGGRPTVAPSNQHLSDL
jgi:hypothetical protein